MEINGGISLPHNTAINNKSSGDSPIPGNLGQVYRGILISGCWNRVVSLYTDVSSFQGVGIEFYCIQRCPYFRVLE